MFTITVSHSDGGVAIVSVSVCAFLSVAVQ